MSFDFPNNPSSGQTYQPAGGPIYTFQNGTWLAGSINSLDIPGGDARYVNVTGDAMTGALTVAADPIAPLGVATKQYVDNGYGRIIGEVISFAGTTAPARWLFCYGQAISRTTYAALFAVLSTTYGAGDGSTTFNLPDCRGRADVGKDNMGGTSANRLTNLAGGLDGDILGAVGGLESHTLTLAQMASHSHGGATGGDSVGHTHTFADASSTTGGVSANHTHTQAGTFASGGRTAAHVHYPNDSTYNFVTWKTAGSAGLGTTWSGGQPLVNQAQTTGETADHAHYTTISGATSGHSADHSHTVAVSGTTGGISVAHTHAVTAEGGAGVHNNVQPAIVFNKIIYAGA